MKTVNAHNVLTISVYHYVVIVHHTDSHITAAYASIYGGVQFLKQSKAN